jgi:hypothetical protein
VGDDPKVEKRGYRLETIARKINELTNHSFANLLTDGTFFNQLSEILENSH